MLEVNNPSNVLNISGEFQREMPIQARRNWSDFLEITPAFIRGRSTTAAAHVYSATAPSTSPTSCSSEGAIASNYQDAQITYVAMGDCRRTLGEDGRVDARADGRRLNINVSRRVGGHVQGSGIRDLGVLVVRRNRAFELHDVGEVLGAVAEIHHAPAAVVERPRMNAGRDLQEVAPLRRA